jgi:hypothetical protein
MKIPWQSSVVVYKTIDGECVAQEQQTFLFVREVAPCIKASQLQTMDNSYKSFKEKLIHCPFMIVDDLAYTCTGVLDAWEQFAILRSSLTVEDECVYVNYAAPTMFYKQGVSGVYDFENAGSVFCKTVCMPLTLNQAMIPKLQHYRQRTVDAQIQSGRIFLGNSKHYTCYNAADFTMLHSLHHVH